MQKISVQSATYYPSSKVKKSADNAIDLLKRIHNYIISQQR